MSRIQALVSDFGGVLTTPLVEAFAGLRDALRAETGRDVALGGFADAYFERLHPNEELIAFFRALRREHGLRLALLTNNVREFEPHWRAKLPVDDLFEVVVDSAFVGMRKPDPEIYELTLSHLGLPAPACLFLDDLDVNVDAARTLGMPAIHFRTTAQAIAEIEAALR